MNKPIKQEGDRPVADLHAEYIERGGRFYACPICVKLRNLGDATWVSTAEVKGAPPSMSTLVFNY